MRRTLASAAAALGLAAALTACGGGPTKAGFVTKADEACGTGNTTLGAINAPSNLPELSTAAGTIATTADTQAGALRALDAPSDDKALVTGLVEAIGAVAPAARTLQDAAGKTDDAATARAANDAKAKADAAAQQATSYGLTLCGVGLQGAANKAFEGSKTVIKAAFVARAEGLCAAANRKAEALPDPGNSLSALARTMNSYIPIAERLFTDIKALAVPPGDESLLAGMFTKQDAVLAKIKEIPAPAQRGNATQVDRLFSDLNTLTVAANAAFDAYGLRQCGTLSYF
jgi:hypothetical protein